MATYFLSKNRGQFKIGQVAVATAAPGSDIYVQINTANNPTREDVILALRDIENYLLSNGIPGGQVGVDLPVL